MSDNTTDQAFLRRGFTGYSPTPSFSGITSFLRRTLTRDLQDVDLAVTGIPFDSATTNRPGTRLGPRAIREASAMQSHEKPYGWDVDPLSELNVADYGDLWYDFADVAGFPNLLRRHIKGILDQDAGVLALGGDHFITYPILQAHVEKYGPLSLLQFDAHTDTWPDRDTSRIDHGTMLYRAVMDGLIVADRSVQVGIRTFNADTLGISIIDSESVHLRGPLEIARQIHDLLGNNRVYLTFDIDALDPAFAPGTGTPVCYQCPTLDMIEKAVPCLEIRAWWTPVVMTGVQTAISAPGSQPAPVRTHAALMPPAPKRRERPARKGDRIRTTSARNDRKWGSLT